MSVTISAVPFLLLYTLGSGVIAAVKAYSDANSKNSDFTLHSDGNFHISEETAKMLYDKKFETTIMDKELLLKTLKEHGAVKIEEDGENISCNCETFHLEFTKTPNNPYSLRISYNEDYNPDELVQDIGDEYTINAQEVSYNKIKERLESQNLEIENEEIYDDNTIVLTVNLE